MAQGATATPSSASFAQMVATPTLPQMAIADFLDNGGYERHLRELAARAG